MHICWFISSFPAKLSLNKTNCIMSPDYKMKINRNETKHEFLSHKIFLRSDFMSKVYSTHCLCLLCLQRVSGSPSPLHKYKLSQASVILFILIPLLDVLALYFPEPTNFPRETLRHISKFKKCNVCAFIYIGISKTILLCLLKHTLCWKLIPLCISNNIFSYRLKMFKGWVEGWEDYWVDE